MDKINVLFVIWGLEPGGAEKVVVTLANHMDRTCFRPVVCCLNDRRGLVLNDDVTAYYLQKKPGFAPAIIWKIKDVIKQENIHIINTHLWTANVWGRLAGFLTGVPVVVTEHSVDTWKSGKYLLADRLLAYIMHTMIAVSSTVRDFYAGTAKVPAEKITVIQNGITVSDFKISADPLRKKNEFGLAQARPLLGSVGRLIPDKGHQYLFKALPEVKKQFPEVKLVVIGDGAERGNLEQMVRHLSLEDTVLFLGTRTRDLPELYGMVDVVVQPSLREGLSLTLLEALASGKPVVTTDVSSNKMVICQDYLGIVVPPGSVAELAGAIIEELHKPVTAEAAARRRTYVQDNFSSTQMVTGTENLFKSILRQGT